MKPYCVIAVVVVVVIVTLLWREPGQPEVES
jgi:hypothetical protein